MTHTIQACPRLAGLAAVWQPAVSTQRLFREHWWQSRGRGQTRINLGDSQEHSTEEAGERCEDLGRKTALAPSGVKHQALCARGSQAKRQVCEVRPLPEAMRSWRLDSRKKKKCGHLIQSEEWTLGCLCQPLLDLSSPPPFYFLFSVHSSDHGAVGAVEAGRPGAPWTGSTSPGVKDAPARGEPWSDPSILRDRTWECQGATAVDLGGAGE